MALLELTTHYSALLRPTSEAFYEMDHKDRVYVIKLPQTRCSLLYEDDSYVPRSRKMVGEMSYYSFRNTFSCIIVSLTVKTILVPVKVEETP
jgi:hypothetical protein